MTSKTNDTIGKQIDELYPKHAEVLIKAKLAPDIFPTLGKVLNDLEEKANEKLKTKSKEKQSQRQNNRQTYFCIGISEVWEEVIHVTLSQLREKQNLKWLCISMSYHKFLNLREIFQSDLSEKLIRGIQSKDFMNLPCNCNVRTKVDGVCAYGGECRKACVVYKATCKLCKHSYIGNTQQRLKSRMDQHFKEVRDLVINGKSLDSFAVHFTKHCE